MNKRINTILLMCITVFFTVINAQATSLWRPTGRLYSEKRNFQVGDLITIIIDENANAQGKSIQNRQKDIYLDMQPGRVRSTGTSTSGKSTSDISSSFPALVFDIQNEIDKEIRNTRSGNLQATISVPITKIHENGNIELEGTKMLRINDEEQEIVVKGMARAEDISSDNTVKSSLLANASIKYKGGLTTSDKDKEKRGLFTRIIDGVLNFLF